MPRLAPLLYSLLFAAAAASGETIELVNGDKLSGEVVESDAESVVLESPIFGRLEIPREQIAVPEPDHGAFGSGLFRG